MTAKRLYAPEFDESADMRLVELQRAALGVPPPERAWDSHIAIEGVSVDVEHAQAPQGAVVTADATATPAGEVIPGAVVTVTLSVANEGAAPARNVRVSAPLPAGAAFRNGSYMRDGRPLLDDAAEELFGNGTLVASIEPQARATFLWKIGVKLGNKPLVIAPQIGAENGAVLGAEPLVISRKPEAQSGFSVEIERFNRRLYAARPVQLEDLPIYELDDEEQLEYEAADAALSTALPEIDEYQPGNEPPLSPQPPTTQPEPAPPPDQPEPDFEPGVPATEPDMPLPPEQPPEIEPAAREVVQLFGRLDRPSVAYFERIFTASKAPTLLNHFILAGALACTRALDESDVGGLKQHMDAQGQLLQRIVLHEKMGRKEPIGEYTGTMLARVDQFVPSPIAEIPPAEDANAIRLQTELETPTLALLEKMQNDAARWDFTKARQLTLALQARRVAANAPPDAVAAAENALRSYAQTAATQLNKFFVRMRIDRTTGLLYVSDDALDAAARTLINALTALF